MAEDFVLSASSLNTYLRCGKQWMFAYVLGIKSPPSLRAVRGIAVHAAVEVNMRQKLISQQDLPITDVLDAYSTSFEVETQDGFETRDGEDKGEIKDMGVALTSIYQNQVAPKIQPVLVEHPIQFTINGQAWTGQIDLADEEPANLWGEPEPGLRVRDTKTSGRAPRPEQYGINMTGYAIGVRQGLGRKESDVIFDYLIATKKPYYEPIHTGQVTDEQIRSFAYLVGDVASSIKAGSFPANGLTNPGICDWCGYRSQCPAYAAKNPNK
jgi:hypothetical protein